MPDHDRAGLFYRVLGPVEVEVNGTPVRTGPTVRRALGALLAAEGQALTDDRLIDRIWPEPPRDPVAALRLIVWRIRNLFGPALRDTLRRTSIGYVLAVPPHATDHAVFTARVTAGLSALSEGEFDYSERTFEAALALWCGEPWSEFGEDAPFVRNRLRLTELRDIAVEELLAARLARGQLGPTVAALRAAVGEAPYRERRWELLALGLYRSGRQVQALAELRRVRDLLATEIGIEPGPRLRTLQQRMLTHDPGLAADCPPILLRAG
ncbi:MULTISPECIES: AfsR/SARP family transcriptional regulator [unclassified Nocardia]|uniref:AfsR/SARP family transcriptional regulator n=1 Tax=unclassified Nocardia TaxID=2637762 RepID=UPI001CE47939|nr:MULTISPECIES: AfsR/SARP family transcriptional regulator [unclassified Nocardia]